MPNEEHDSPRAAQTVEDRFASALGVERPAQSGAAGPRAWWRGLDPRTRRRLRIALIAGTVFVLVASFVLARYLQTENVERDADLAVIQAQVRGDAAAMLSKLSGCSAKPACVSQVRANVRNPRLLRHGDVKILLLNSDTAYSPFGSTGPSRVAWTVIGTLPVVQCVQVRRSGNFLTGIHVHVLSISAPIPNEGDC